MKVIRHGNCNRCGECCRNEEFKIPGLWKDGRCIFLDGNECSVRGSDKRPRVCKEFPTGRENFLIEKLEKGEKKLDFKPLLSKCTFWFEVAEQ